MQKHRFFHFALIVLFFVFIAVFFSSESLFFYLVKGKQPDFWKDFGWSAIRWIPWAFFMPLIVRLVRRFPAIDRENASRNRKRVSS